MTALITEQRRAFHAALLAEVLHIDAHGVPANADKDSKNSLRLAQSIAEQLKAETGRSRLAGQTAGNKFEALVASFVEATFLPLQHLRPGNFTVHKVGSRTRLSIAGFDQYSHLEELAKLAAANPELAVALGADYIIAPDVVVVRSPEPDKTINKGVAFVDDASARLTALRAANQPLPTLHASISCKWTLRSDRAQNAKSEALNLVRHRKGRLPHVVAITGEPLPSRIASLALGTGDLDCVYHFALPELFHALESVNDLTGLELYHTMVTGKRLKDISDLPLDLAL